jgi:signal peptide peptidase SppA
MKLNMANFWSVEPGAFTRMVEAAGRERLVAGPAQDANDGGLPITVAGPLAVIPIRGIIEKRGSFFSMLFGGTSTLLVEEALNAALADEDVKAILLQIDSPGGSVDGLSDLGDALYAARGQKRIVAQIDGMGASAAYYIAAQADEVYAGRTDMVGSIGTVWAWYDYSELFQKQGVRPVILTTGEHKAVGYPGTEITEAQQAELQKITDFYGADFVAAVARGRGMTKPAVKKIADGRVFVAPEAKELGLIDGVRSMGKTVKALAKDAGRRPRLTRARAKAMQAGLDAPSAAFRHNSTTVDDEPDWGEVDKTELPYRAFVWEAPGTDEEAKSTWKYPHHFVRGGTQRDDNGVLTNGTMYLHRGGLNAAWAAAQGARTGKKAAPAIITHLRKHRDALGMEED